MCVVLENCDSLGVIYWMLVFDAVFGVEVRWSIGGGLEVLKVFRLFKFEIKLGCGS